ncbi:MAG: hypothetical protein AAFV32_00200 [Myxococcota bacterium]
MSEQTKSVVTVLGVLAVVVGGIVGATLLFRSSTGSGAGGPCTSGMDCTPGLYCVGEVCAPSCESDADCSELGFRCSDVQVVRQRYGVEFDAGTTRLCAPNTIGGSIADSVAASSLERERKMALMRKRPAVSNALRALRRKSGEPPPKPLSPKEFDALWQQIPEEERLNAEVDALAEKMMELEASQDGEQ